MCKLKFSDNNQKQIYKNKNIYLPIFIAEHSILSDLEEVSKERFIIPSLVDFYRVESVKCSETDLEFYLQFTPFLPGTSND